MRAVWKVWIPVWLMACAAMGAEITLPTVRDAKISFHRSEKDFNYGKSHHLRTRGIQTGSGEVVLLDFDRDQLKAFADRHRTKQLAGTLSIFVRSVQGDSAKVEICTLDSAVDWNEGDKNGAQAEEGESCFTAARFGGEPWKTVKGKDVANLRDLLYDKQADSILTKKNSGSLEIKKDLIGQEVTFELDPAIVKHLASDKKCRGLVLFNRSAKTKVGFFSMDQHGKASGLTVVTK